MFVSVWDRWVCFVFKVVGACVVRLWGRVGVVSPTVMFGLAAILYEPKWRDALTYLSRGHERLNPERLWTKRSIIDLIAKGSNRIRWEICMPESLDRKDSEVMTM